jgi:hypothetical protein
MKVMIQRSWRLGGWLKGPLCLALALILSVLGFRSTFAYLVTLGSPSTTEGEGDALSQLKTRNRRPKPTRQQELTSSERLSQDPSPLRRRTLLPVFLGGWPDCSRLIRVANETAIDRVWIETTKPEYLKPCEAAPLSQFPPPV